MSSRAESPLVLVADDDEDMRELACLHLREAGYIVIEAHDGEEALKLARERHPDLCVFDVIMPGMRGHEVLKAMREDNETETIPVMLVTATLEDRAFWKLGPTPDGYLRKSRFIDLESKVGELLAAGGTREQQE